MVVIGPDTNSHSVMVIGVYAPIDDTNIMNENKIFEKLTVLLETIEKEK